jgi:hypothetical protein
MGSGIAQRLMTIDRPEDAAAFISRQYERPANADAEAAKRGALAGNLDKSVTINQTIHSTAPAQDVAAEASRMLQDHISAAYTELNLGPAY